MRIWKGRVGMDRIEGQTGMAGTGNGETGEQAEGQDVDALVALLDRYTRAGESRIKLEVVEGQGEMLSHRYHHGRCDIGSPWAKGTAFDVLEEGG